MWPLHAHPHQQMEMCLCRAVVNIWLQSLMQEGDHTVAKCLELTHAGDGFPGGKSGWQGAQALESTLAVLRDALKH